MQVLRAMTQDELERALRIRMEVFVEEQGVPSELEVDEYDASPVACHHFVVMDGGDAVATGRWKPFEADAVKMQRIAVRLPNRGGGVGKQLLQAMEEDARQAGFRYSVLDAQCTAEKFYAKLGYEVVSTEPFLDADIWHVRMRKNLEL
jgi:predicted GNAT family N-acyltransferase